MNIKKDTVIEQTICFLITFLMYVNNNKIHGGCDIHNQVQSFHDFIQCIVGGLPPANHHRQLTHGTVGELVFEGVDHVRNALVHQAVQVGGLPRHFRHHANLKKTQKKFSMSREEEEDSTHIFFFFFTHRESVFYEAVAVVAADLSGGV